MKLIELLVQELPKRGGWPDGVRNIEMFASGMIFFDGDCAPKEFNLPQCSDGWEKGMGRNYTNAVTQEQYEAALAAAQQPVWNGEGLPPVDCECEARVRVNTWEIIQVLAVTSEYLVAKIGETETVFHLEQSAFRPIRSEADKKRDEVIEALKYYVSAVDASDLYDAIVAGEVKGVKLDV